MFHEAIQKIKVARFYGPWCITKLSELLSTFKHN